MTTEHETAGKRTGEPQGLSEAPAAKFEPDLVVDLGNKLAALRREVLRLDQEGVDAVARGERQVSDPNPEFEKVEQEADAVENEMIATQARSLAGALAQIPLASCYAERLTMFDPPDPADFDRVKRLLWSIRRVLERESGVSGKDLAAGAYMPDKQDPFLAASTPAETEPIGHLKFSHPEGGLCEATSTIEDWYVTARIEFALSKNILPVLNSTDEELERIIRAEDDLERYMTLAELCRESRDRALQGVEVYGAAQARILIVLSRITGESKPEQGDQPKGGAS